MPSSPDILTAQQGFLGLDVDTPFADTRAVIVPFGLEASVSYGGGTANGPAAIITASHQVELFDEELDQLTEEAILSVGGKLDAYQRMFDEEVGSKELDRQFDAAKYIFNRTEKFDEKAGLLTEEIMKNVILSQSTPNTP